MPRFLDVHPMKGLNEDMLKALQKSSEDGEFKVKHLNIMYNPEVNKCFCLLEAPSLEAVEKNHEKLGRYVYFTTMQIIFHKVSFYILGLMYITRNKRTVFLLTTFQFECWL